MSEWKIAPSQVYDNGTISPLESNDIARINLRMFCIQHGIELTIVKNEDIASDFLIYDADYKKLYLSDAAREENINAFINFITKGVD